MRRDLKEPDIVYKDFWDWVLNYPNHVLYLFSFVLAYYFYISSTEEV